MSDDTEERDDFNADAYNHAAAVAQLKDFADEIRRVASKADILAEDEAYLAELTGKFDALDARRKTLEREALVQRVDVVSGKATKSVRGATSRDLDDDPFGEPDSIRTAPKFANPWDENEIGRFGRSESEIGAEYRARAMTAIEKMSGTNDHRRQAMTKIIEEWDGDGRLARQALRTSSPEYMRAFVKMALGKASTMTPVEAAAVDRAMSLTDNAGGYLVPFQLDPSVIITANGSFNPIRQIAKRVIATGDVWNGVSSGAVSWSFDAEAAEVSDDTTTFAQPSISIHMARGFIPISIEAAQDEANVASVVGELLAFGKDELEASKFTTGTGSGEPYGFVTALAGTASEVAATTDNSFGLPDVYKLDEQLPARYRARASWAAHRVIYNDVRQFDTAGGAALWERLGADVPGLLLGRPAYEVEAMDSTYPSGNNYVLVFGDFSNYVIADRVGTTVEFIQHLFHTSNNRPSGQRGWFAHFRVGADSVNDGAFRILNV